MTQDSNMRAGNFPNVISSACRSITLSARPVVARLRTVPCGECSRPIRCWNGRIWLLNGARWAHLQCWQRLLFFERHIQLMADEIRHRQIKVDEFLPSPQPQSQPSDYPANNKVRYPVASATALGQPVERLEVQQTEDLSPPVRIGRTTEEERPPSMTIDSTKTSSSCVSKVIRFSGKVDFGNFIRIEGEAEGEITGDEIEIAASAVVSARITANRLRVGGHFYGEIVARDRIELLPTARLRCSIITPRLVVAEGAQFDGDCIAAIDSCAA
jgi:cytoskeletal protein CcmA (bactofilin family)